MNVFAKLILGGILLFGAQLANAQEAHGVLRVVKGDVQIKSAKTGQTTKARLGQQIDPQDVIITGKESRAKIVMVDNNEINVSPESQIEIQHYQFDPNAGKKDVLLNVIYGKVRAKVEQHYDGKTSKFQVKTPSAVAGVRGTDFMTSFNRADRSSQVVTFRGSVEFGQPGPGGTIRNGVFVNPGMTSHSVAGGQSSPPSHMSKGEFAKIDNDSKAETNGQGKDNGSRQPSNDNGKGNKGNNNSSGNGASNSNGGGANHIAEGLNPSTAGGAESSGGSTTTQPVGRDPASGPGGGGNPGPMVGPGDLPSNGGPLSGPNTPPAPAPPPQFLGPPPTAPQTCVTCQAIIQQGNTKVLVHVTK